MGRVGRCRGMAGQIGGHLRIIVAVELIERADSTMPCWPPVFSRHHVRSPATGIVFAGAIHWNLRPFGVGIAGSRAVRLELIDRPIVEIERLISGIAGSACRVGEHRLSGSHTTDICAYTV